MKSIYQPKLNVGTIIRLEYESYKGYRYIIGIQPNNTGDYTPSYQLRSCTKTGKQYTAFNVIGFDNKYIDENCPVIGQIQPVKVKLNTKSGVRKRRITYLEARIAADTKELAKLRKEEEDGT